MVAAHFVSKRVDAVCGSSNGSHTDTRPTANLCYSGQPGAMSGNGSWQWTCAGEYGGSNASCSTDATGCMPSPIRVVGTRYAASESRESEM